MTQPASYFRGRWKDFGFAVIVTAAVIAFRLALPRSLTGDRPLVIVFVLPTLFSAYISGTAAGLLSTAVVAAVTANVIFPSNGFTLARPLDLTQWIVLIVTGVLVSILCGALRRARRRAEESARALEIRERQYRLLFEESPLPKLVYDRQTMGFLAVNKAAQNHYGYSQAEFLQMTMRDIGLSQDRAAVDAGVLVAEGEDPESGERRHRTKDGAIIDVIVSASDFQIEGRDVRLIAIQDITARKAAKSKLQAQVAQLNLLHQITRATGERLDLPSILQVVVRSLEENLLFDLCCICLYDAASRSLTVKCVGAHNGSLVTELALANDAKIPIDANGLTRCVQGQLIYEADIAGASSPFPQRLARAGLRSLVYAPLVIEGKVSGVLIGARRAARSLTTGDCEFLAQVCEHTALAANQAELHGALQRAYDDLRTTQQTIMQQERVRALGQMASGIAHDINNAISPAALYAESILEQEQNLSARAREKLGTIRKALADVAQTVARMREFYRRRRESPLALAPINLNQLVREVIELTHARWYDLPQRRGIVIAAKAELARGIPAIMGVESEIRDSLVNLVFNAVDAMPAGGTLTLTTRVSGTRAAPLVQIEVADTGVGMDAETRSRCLEPFFTTKGERGTGLGLAMVYGMVQRHSAEIEIESAPGKGTRIRLNFASAPGAEPTPPPAPTTTRHGKGLALLVIDDDPLVLRSLCDALEADGHVVAAANGGQSGIDAFRAAVQNQRCFAAVITDLGMPHVDGRKVAAEIKATSPETPVILLTGWGQRLATDGDVPAHVDQVLAKPPTLRDLRDALARYQANAPA